MQAFALNTNTCCCGPKCGPQPYVAYVLFDHIQKRSAFNIWEVYGAGAEPDIFIWGGHWRDQFCNKGSYQWSV